MNHPLADTTTKANPDTPTANNDAVITRRLYQLTKTVEVTRELATSLHGRLGPVLGPSYPTPDSGEVAAERAEQSPLAEEIDRINERLGQVGDVLRDALDRLEVSQ